ncbi:MAG: hypothetical protein J7K00_00730 [Candidatus Diapherotrites archaeon]|nr:hypothetical protein [Candidatus Diapherotrites archaeon]
MNILLRGKSKQIIDSMVEEGYANTKSEAIRMTIINFGEDYLNEIKSVNKKLDKLDKDIDSGKRKLLDVNQALGSYSRHVE